MLTPSTDSRTAHAASEMMQLFGDAAAREAAARADASRDRGNAINFCHWRQVERFILVLQTPQPPASVH